MRLAILVLATATASPCASMSGGPVGDVVVAIETSQAISRLEFLDDETGNPLHITAVPPGSYLHREALPVGRYCLKEWVIGAGDFAAIHEPPSETCIDVVEGKQAYPGHFVFGADGTLTMRSDPQCMANQLAEYSSLGNTNVTPCDK